MIGLTFSEEDADLAALTWHAHSVGYATRKVFAHRIILERKIGRPLVKGELCDHINRNKLDNRRENLRVANKSLNSVNRDMRPDNTTGFTGVYLHWPKEHQQKGWGKRWAARVQRNGTVKNLGYFKTPEEANQARLDYLLNP